MRKILFIVLILTFIFTGCSSTDIDAVRAENEALRTQIAALQSRIDELESASASPAPAEAAPVQDGLLEITIKGTEFQTIIENELIHETFNTDGQFVIIDLSLKNVGKKQVTLGEYSFSLYDSEDRQYRLHQKANLALPDGSSLNEAPMLFGLTIAPGFTKEGKIVFEVPSDAEGLELEVYDGVVRKRISL